MIVVRSLRQDLRHAATATAAAAAVKGRSHVRYALLRLHVVALRW